MRILGNNSTLFWFLILFLLLFIES